MYYWYVNCGSLLFVDGNGDLAQLSPVSVRYRKDMSGSIQDDSPNSTYNGRAQNDEDTVVQAWGDQDDGLDDDVQLSALYLAVSRASDLAGGDQKLSAYFFSKHNFLQKELKVKYNSAKYRDITIRPYSF